MPGARPRLHRARWPRSGPLAAAAEERIPRAGGRCALWAPAPRPEWADDDELLVRASAVLKSQGPEKYSALSTNWRRGHEAPDPPRAGQEALGGCNGRARAGLPSSQGGRLEARGQLRGTVLLFFLLLHKIMRALSPVVSGRRTSQCLVSLNRRLQHDRDLVHERDLGHKT